MEKISIVAMRREKNSELETAALLRARRRLHPHQTIASVNTPAPTIARPVLSTPINQSTTNEFTFEVTLGADHSRVVMDALRNHDSQNNGRSLSKNNSRQTPGKTIVLKFNVTPPEPGRIFTSNEACEILRVSRRTLYRFVKKGQLVGYRIGSKLRFKEKDLYALLSD